MEGCGAPTDLPLNGSNMCVVRTGCPVTAANGASTELQDLSLLLGFNNSTLSGNSLFLGLYFNARRYSFSNLLDCKTHVGKEDVLLKM